MSAAQGFNPDRAVAIIGMGVMGTKVAWACARAGVPVQAFDVDAAKIEASIALALSWSEGEERDLVQRLLVGRSTLEQAVEDVQLVFENVPEVDAIKRDVIQRIAPSLLAGALLLRWCQRNHYEQTAKDSFDSDAVAAGVA
jgi:3-hydroxyacyl-CoA dehydrogenase